MKSIVYMLSFHITLPALANGKGRMARNTGTDASESAAGGETDMSLFPQKDEAAHGHYRTKDTILEIYDAMQHAIATGEPYQTRLDPPPADPRCCHPPKEERDSEHG